MRHQERLLGLCIFDADPDVLSIDQDALRVREYRAHQDRIGRAIDRDVGEVHRAGRRVRRVVGQLQANDGRLAAVCAFLAPAANLHDLALTDRERHIDGVLADHGGEGARFRADQRALLVGGQSDTAINRRNDARVAKVDLSLQERSLGLQDCGVSRQLLA